MIKSTRSLKEGKYIAINAVIDGFEYKVLNFRSTYADFSFSTGEKVDMLVNAEINEYNGKTSVTLKLADIRRSGFSQERYFAARSAYERLCLGEDITEVPPQRIVPDRDTQMKIYDIVKLNGRISACADAAQSMGFNYCLFRVTLDIFESAGLIRIDEPGDRIERISVNGKVNLDNCKVLSDLKRRFGIA